MTKECKGLCEDHGDLMERTGSILGQLTIMIRVMFVLVAGMGYSVIQNHSASINLVKMDNRLINTEAVLVSLSNREAITAEAVIDSAKDYNDRLASLEKGIYSLSALCCGELDEVTE